MNVVKLMAKKQTYKKKKTKANVVACLRLPLWKRKSRVQYLSFQLVWSRCTCLKPLDKCLKERLVNRIILKR